MYKRATFRLLIGIALLGGGALASTCVAEVAPPVAATTLLPVVAPASNYFPLLPFGAGEDALPQLLPVASNYALSGVHKGIHRAIVVAHDSSRDATTAVSVMAALAGNAVDSTLILSPQFLIDADIVRFSDHLPDHGKLFARWPFDGWQDGGDSVVKPPQKGISSFTAMDMLLLYLGEKDFFPDLEQIVVVGHGSGGDFVHRYAAMGQAPDVLDRQNVPVRFVVGDASSYLYFTASRPKGVGERQQGFGVPDVAACPDYNAYKYGLMNLNGYGQKVGFDAIRLRYVARTVVYLNGEKASQSDPAPDTSCAAKLQGSDRLARAVNYDAYLMATFGEASRKMQKFIVVPKIGYDPIALYGSNCGMASLFGNGMCE